MIEQQAEFFPEEMTEDERRQAVIDQLTQQNQGQSVQKWLDDLQKAVHIPGYSCRCSKPTDKTDCRKKGSKGGWYQPPFLSGGLNQTHLHC